MFADGNYTTALSMFYTDFENAYCFFFDPDTSTRNLGRIPEVDCIGLELEGKAQFTEHLSGYFSLGYTDSEIKKATVSADNGNQAPPVTEYAVNPGGEWRYPLSLFGGVEEVVWVEHQRMGDTWWALAKLRFAARWTWLICASAWLPPTIGRSPCRPRTCLMKTTIAVSHLAPRRAKTSCGRHRRDGGVPHLSRNSSASVRRGGSA